MEPFSRLFKKVRYLNLANNINIDDHCLTKLHFIDESLEYLDLSGTNVTLNGLGTGTHELLSLLCLNLPRTASVMSMSHKLTHNRDVIVIM